MDAACALAAGATCLSDIEMMTRQVEIFGAEGGASDTTMLRVLDELAGRLNDDGLPGRRLARAMAAARAKAWSQIAARHERLPAVRVADADLTRAGVGGSPARPVVSGGCGRHLESGRWRRQQIGIGSCATRTQSVVPEQSGSSGTPAVRASSAR